LTLIDDLDTPALLVEYSRLTRNIHTFARMAAGAGVSLRPHVKTHKTQEIARLQLKARCGGITVAKLSEAEVYLRAGIDDIFVAYPVVGEGKWRRAAELNRSGRVVVGVESTVGIRGLAQAADRDGQPVPVRVEFDSGLGRSGVPAAELERLCAEVMDHASLELDGIFTFRSSAFPGSDGRSADELGREEGTIAADTADRLRKAGFRIGAVSAGSTPTARSVASVTGVTEVRPGTYVFHDLMTRADGACRTGDLALSVITTVVSRPWTTVAIVDAGSKTLAGDAEVSGSSLQCFAATEDARGRVVWLNEEHGALELSEGWSPAIGERIRLIPAHACTVVNLADELVVVDGDVVVDTWAVAARGCNR
jgi:D-serine deaminase-like pyridoxal phosphate-dependent protein